MDILRAFACAAVVLLHIFFFVHGFMPMKSKRFHRNVLLTLLFTVFLALAAAAFHAYMHQEIYVGNAEQLLATYAQTNKTFTLFTQRNWSALSDWDEYLQAISHSENPEDRWDAFAHRKNNWNYSDFYVFNESCDFRTANNRRGTADSIQNIFPKMYEMQKPCISTYTASSGIRKIVFASPLQEPLTLGSVIYTGIAISYDAAAVEDMLSSEVYSEYSSCYVVNAHGDTILSLKPREGGEESPGNLFTFLQEKTSFTRNTAAAFIAAVSQGEKETAMFRTRTASYYLTCQPTGINDWSVIGIVQSRAVDASSKKIMNLTMLAFFGLDLLLCILVVRLVTLHGRFELEKEKSIHTALEEQKSQLDQLFLGMTRIVDRYAVGDFVNDRYEYHEHLLPAPLYPESGSYQDLVEAITAKYVVLSDTEKLKLGQLLNKEYLQKTLRNRKDVLRIEYGGRTENVYKILHVVPVKWDNEGTPEKVMMISQDIGKRYELENLANTDGLTGLFNERCFSSILHRKESRQLPFVLYYLDLDRFKPVNDTYGHDMGDKLLKEVAHRLQHCIREHDYAFRIGGDEFALILSSALDSAHCEEIKERIARSLLAPFVIDGKTLQLGVSCGYAVYPRESDDVSKLRILADQRMYAEKEENHKSAGNYHL